MDMRSIACKEYIADARVPRPPFVDPERRHPLAGFGGDVEPELRKCFVELFDRRGVVIADISAAHDPDDAVEIIFELSDEQDVPTMTPVKCEHVTGYVRSAHTKVSQRERHGDGIAFESDAGKLADSAVCA